MNDMATGTKSPISTALAVISGEEGSKPHWIVVASQVEEIRQSGAWRLAYNSPTEWLEAAAKAANLTPNTLRRFLAAFRYLKTKQAADSSIDLFSGSSAFDIGAIELIKRIGDISPSKADEYLTQHMKEDVSYRDIKRGYDLIVVNPPYATSATANPDAGKLGLRRTHDVKKRLADVVQKQIGDLSDTEDAKVLPGRYEFEFASPDVVAVGSKEFSVDFVDGFEFKRLGTKVAPSALRRAIADIAFAATFFRRYWVFIDADHEAASALNTSIEKLGLLSVGIAFAPEPAAKKLKILRRPKAPPSPDRHDMARQAVLAQGLPT